MQGGSCCLLKFLKSLPEMRGRSTLERRKEDYRGCCLRLEWNIEAQEDAFGPLDQTLNQKDLCTQQTYHSWWATSTFAFTLLPHSITHTHAHGFCKAEGFQELSLCLCLHFLITEHSSAQKSVFMQRATRDLSVSCCIQGGYFRNVGSFHCLHYCSKKKKVVTERHW